MSSPVLIQTCKASQNDAVSITMCSSNFSVFASVRSPSQKR